MERLLSTQDLAEVTGLSVQTIYNRHSNGGSLPDCLNLGGRLRFRQRDVDAWLGVRSQSWELIQFARSRGYSGEVPFLFHMQKIRHGIPLRLG